MADVATAVMEMNRGRSRDEVIAILKNGPDAYQYGSSICDVSGWMDILDTAATEGGGDGF